MHRSDPTVLFDLGNTLVRLDLERGWAHLRRLAAESRDATGSVGETFFCEASLACNRGELSGEAFLDALALRLGRPELSRAALGAAWCDIFSPWPEMERLAEQVLEAGHRAFLLSNTDPLHFASLAPRLPVLERFDGLFLSYEAGRIKPDPAFFEDALARFDLSPESCLFLDDREENVEAARAVGIRAMVVGEDARDVERFLHAHGVLLRRAG